MVKLKARKFNRMRPRRKPLPLSKVRKIPKVMCRKRVTMVSANILRKNELRIPSGNR